MRVRKTDANGDYVPNSFWINQPEGVAQVAGSRLSLWTGQWYFDPSEGIDWAGKVLGKVSASIRDGAIKDRLAGTPGVSGFGSYSAVLDHATRDLTVKADLVTPYGTAPVNITQ